MVTSQKSAAGLGAGDAGATAVKNLRRLSVLLQQPMDVKDRSDH